MQILNVHIDGLFRLFHVTLGRAFGHGAASSPNLGTTSQLDGHGWSFRVLPTGLMRSGVDQVRRGAKCDEPRADAARGGAGGADLARSLPRGCPLWVLPGILAYAGGKGAGFHCSSPVSDYEPRELNWFTVVNWSPK